MKINPINPHDFKAEIRFKHEGKDHYKHWVGEALDALATINSRLWRGNPPGTLQIINVSGCACHGIRIEIARAPGIVTTRHTGVSNSMAFRFIDFNDFPFRDDLNEIVHIPTHEDN